MTNKEKDEKIKRLLKILEATRAQNQRLKRDKAFRDARIKNLEENEAHRVRKHANLCNEIEAYKQASEAAIAGEKVLQVSLAYIEKKYKDLQSDVDKLRQLKTPENRDGGPIERLKRQHGVLLQLAAFAQGIMLAELVDNPSENLGYDIGSARLKTFIAASEAIILEK